MVEVIKYGPEIQKEIMNEKSPMAAKMIAKGNRDIMEQSKNGYILEEQNPKLFADTILKVWNDKEQNGKMSAYAQEFAKRFDSKNYVDRLLEVYKQ